MAMNISCKFEYASYNIFFIRAVTVKSLYTLWRRRCRRNEVKSIVSTGTKTCSAFTTKIMDSCKMTCVPPFCKHAVLHLLPNMPNLPYCGVVLKLQGYCTSCTLEVTLNGFKLGIQRWEASVLPLSLLSPWYSQTTRRMFLLTKTKRPSWKRSHP